MNYLKGRKKLQKIITEAELERGPVKALIILQLDGGGNTLGNRGGHLPFCDENEVDDKLLRTWRCQHRTVGKEV